jgi:hypothetical protein
MNYDKIHYKYFEHCSGIIRSTCNGDINPIIWHKNFNKYDVYLAFSGYFYGTWENSGYFFHQVDCWGEYSSTVVSMFNFFGMGEIGLLYSRAMEIELISKGMEYEELPDLIKSEITDIELLSSKGDQYKIMVDRINSNYEKYQTLKNCAQQGDAPEPASPAR